MFIVSLIGERSIDIVGRPDLSQRLVLGLVTVVLPAAALPGWLVSRVLSPARQAADGRRALVSAAFGAIIGGRFSAEPDPVGRVIRPVLGLTVVTPPVPHAWTRANGRFDGQLLGMTPPVPDALIQTAMMLTAIPSMYLAAIAATDVAYRAGFLDPMLDDLRVTLLARNRYRSSPWWHDHQQAHWWHGRHRGRS